MPETKVNQFIITVNWKIKLSMNLTTDSFPALYKAWLWDIPDLHTARSSNTYLKIKIINLKLEHYS